MYDYFCKKLPTEFIVEPPRKENIKSLGKGILPEEITEYAKSKADIIIRKDQLVTQDVFKCCVVSLTDDVPAVNWTKGLVGEIKLDDETEYPESECFRNMSALAASMSMEILSQGVLDYW